MSTIPTFLAVGLFELPQGGTNALFAEVRANIKISDLSVVFLNVGLPPAQFLASRGYGWAQATRVVGLEITPLNLKDVIPGVACPEVVLAQSGRSWSTLYRDLQLCQTFTQSEEARKYLEGLLRIPAKIFQFQGGIWIPAERGLAVTA